MGAEVFRVRRRRRDPAQDRRFAAHLSYRLGDGVQVRQEKFGLLFYSYRGPRLFFLSSKNLISDRFFEGRQTLGDLAKAIQKEHGLPSKKVQDRLAQIVEALEAKGLIHGQSIC